MYICLSLRLQEIGAGCALALLLHKALDAAHAGSVSTSASLAKGVSSNIVEALYYVVEIELDKLVSISRSIMTG